MLAEVSQDHTLKCFSVLLLILLLLSTEYVVFLTVRPEEKGLWG